MTRPLVSIGYSFKNIDLMKSALTHRSMVGNLGKNTQDREQDNQRLEFLGDAVLDLAIGEYLFGVRPRLKEGEMSRLRAGLVCEARLVEVAKSLSLGRYLIMGAGEDLGGGRNKNSLLADAMEAILGAVYLDGGYERANEFIISLWAPYLDNLGACEDMLSDFKTRLQELTQSQNLGTPVYELLETEGPPHARTFTMGVRLEGKNMHKASARSKKEAEQLAARELLSELTEETAMDLETSKVKNKPEKINRKQKSIENK